MQGASISTVLGLALVAVAILAASTGATGDNGDEVVHRFAAIDYNGDGYVTIEEARAVSAGLARHFDKFDRDDDGALSLAEYRRHSEPADPAQG